MDKEFEDKLRDKTRAFRVSMQDAYRRKAGNIVTSLENIKTSLKNIKAVHSWLVSKLDKK